MSELNYSGGGGRPGSTGSPAADAYGSQAAPYQRNRYDQERWSRIQADNALMSRKLGEVRREPPAGFHAPTGYKSVGQGKQAPGGKAQSGMPETLHYVPPTSWPPKEPAHEASRAAKQQREVSLANAHVAAKLRGIYKHRPDSFLEAHGLGAGFDCNARWAQRTALYDTAAGGGGGGGGLAAAGGGASGKTLDLEQASVPKSLGVAHCGGCGARCFYSADGLRLMRCRGCKAAWYCSEACAQLDYASHKAMCKYTTTGHWTPGGVRPPDEHWVNNAAMAVVRQQLRQRAAALAANGSGSGSGSPASVGGVGGGGGSPGASGHSLGAGGGGSGGVKGSPRVGGKAGGGSAGAKGVRASGVEPLAVEQMDGEMDVLFGLSARYKELRERELEAEREQREVEWRADNGLDGPRPCMYQPRRFAPPSGGQGQGGKGGRPASAGAAVGRGRKPGWQDTASYL